MWSVKVFRGGGDMECVRRAVAVEVENPPPELYAVEEQYCRVVEEVAVYVAERGRLEGERYKELYRRFRKQHPLPANPAGYKPRRRDRQVFSEAEEKRLGLEEKKIKKRELRHRITQTPFRKLIRAVEDKAREAGSVVVYVSSYRNSKVCPIHFTLLRDGGSWHVLHCPRGHVVDRDAVAVLNMLWKITPEGVVKGVWWDVKEVRKRLNKGIVPSEAVGKRIP